MYLIKYYTIKTKCVVHNDIYSVLLQNVCHII